MSSVTQRIKEVKQPWGGYIKPSELCIKQMDDKKKLFENESIHPTLMGIVVDYLTRFMIGHNIGTAFDTAFMGAFNASMMGMKEANVIANQLATEIVGLDDNSIVKACMLCQFDVWYRNTAGALLAKTYKDINVTTDTIQNIRTMVERSLQFCSEYGPIIEYGFTFEPGGYTETVNTGDGDFLTKDTLWDFKVSKAKPTSKHTLQLLMYYIMGKHSGQSIFKSINSIGIYNPRLNTVYTYDMHRINKELIEEIETSIIRY